MDAAHPADPGRGHRMIDQLKRSEMFRRDYAHPCGLFPLMVLKESHMTEEQVRQLQQENANLKANVEKLVDEKYRLQAEVDELRHRVASMSGMGIQKNEPDTFHELHRALDAQNK